MSSTALIGLMTLGFAILVWGKGLWWLGICMMILATVMAFSSGEEPAVRPVAVGAVQAKPTAKPAAKPAEVNEGFDAWDMKWSPTTFADGMAGNKMENIFGEKSSVGSRSGAYTQDMGPIRFKDDFRFRITGDAGDFYKMCQDEYNDNKALVAWDFRTRKDYFPGLHTGNVKTVESPDDMTNPGLGSPNEWIAELMKKKQQR